MCFRAPDFDLKSDGIGKSRSEKGEREGGRGRERGGERENKQLKL